MLLHEKALSVRTADDLVKFLRDMSLDAREHPHEWENLTIESFLEAASAHLETKVRQMSKEESLHPHYWAMFANVCHAAKSYE
jgi:hypothetical protein